MSRRRLRRSSRALIRVGAVLLVLSLIATLVGGLTTRSLLNNLTSNSSELLDGTATVTLDAGTQRGLYVTGGLIAPGETVPTHVQDITCTVEGPSGPVPVSHLKDEDRSVGLDTALARFQVVGSFRALADGEHRIDCTGLGVVVAPEVSPASALLRLGSLLLGSLGVFAGATFLLIGGLLRLLVRRGEGEPEDLDDDEDVALPPEQGAEEWWQESEPVDADGAPEEGSREAVIILPDSDYVELSDEELAALSEEEIEDLVASGALIFVDEDDQLIASSHDDTPDETERGDTYR